MQITVLKLNIPLHPRNIPAFRGAINELVGIQHEAFHNHNNAQGQNHFYWNYPQIQYSTRRGKATIIALGSASELLQQQLIPKLSGTLSFGGHDHPLDGFSVETKNHEWHLLDRPSTFGLFGWLALNQRNYKQWKKATASEHRLSILNRAITGHLRLLTEAADLLDLSDVNGEVVSIDNQKRIRWHSTDFVRFHALIRTNLALPYGIHIGRCAAFGFGEVISAPFYLQRV